MVMHACCSSTVLLETYRAGESKQKLREHVSSFMSWTTDLGTEVQLPQFKALGIEAVLPEWFHQKLETDDVVSDFEANQPAQPAEPAEQALPSAIMPQCLIIPGALHIIHNLTQDVHKKLEYWDTFWDLLQPIARLLAERPLRERFISQCIRGSAAAEHEEAFQFAGVRHLYEKRWQVVTLCMSHLIPLFPVLRQAWSQEKFMADSNIESTVPEAVSAALSNELFCNYIYMVQRLHEVLTHFEAFLESCPCHHHLLKKAVRRNKRNARQAFAHEKIPFAECPMRGKRASELAAGAIQDLLASLFEAAFHAISRGHDAALSDENKGIIS